MNEPRKVTCVVCKRRLLREKARELETTDGFMCPENARRWCVERAIEVRAEARG